MVNFLLNVFLIRQTSETQTIFKIFIGSFAKKFKKKKKKKNLHFVSLLKSSTKQSVIVTKVFILITLTVTV